MTKMMKAVSSSYNRLTRKQVIVTVLATSSVWIALDICMFFSSGAYSSAESKLPVERRKLSDDGRTHLPNPLKARERESSNGNEIKSPSTQETARTTVESSYILDVLYVRDKGKQTHKLDQAGARKRITDSSVENEAPGYLNDDLSVKVPPTSAFKELNELSLMSTNTGVFANVLWLPKHLTNPTTTPVKPIFQLEAEPQSTKHDDSSSKKKKVPTATLR